MRLLLALLLALGIPQPQGPILPGPGYGPFNTPNSNFAYVAGSATGCFNNASGTQCIYALHQSVGAGHLLICGVTWSNSGFTVTFTSTNNTWTAVSPAKAGIGTNNGTSAEMFYVKSATAGADTIDLTVSSSVGFNSWLCAEYSYSGTISSTDGTPAYSTTAASGGVATISGVTTTGSSDIVSAQCLAVTSGCSAGTGFTYRTDTSACDYHASSSCSTTGSYQANTGQGMEDKVNVAAGAQSATFGTGTTDDVILGLIAF